MAPSAEIVSPSLDGTFGAILIGTFIGLVLYGMVIHQTYRYFVLYREDGPWLKSLVAAIFVLETFHIVSSTHICYFYLVKHYNDPKRLLTGAWSINSLTATSGVVIMLSQRREPSYFRTDVRLRVLIKFLVRIYTSFFARRVYLLGRYRVVVYLSIACLLGELGFFAAATAKAFISPVLSEFQHYTWLISTGAAMAQVADVLLTTTLMIMLRNSRTGVKRMDTVIDALMLYAVNTGMLTSIVNSLTFIFSLLLPKDLIYGAMGIVATKLYANSLLAALNARKSLTLRAMYDLDAEWVDIPVTPQRANAVIQQSPAKNVGIPTCTCSSRVTSYQTATLTTLSTSQGGSQDFRGGTSSGFTLIGTAV